MATLQSGKCFTVPTFFGMCCRSEWQERMYIYKWHEVDQTKHEIFCVHIVCNEIQVKVNLEITTFFLFAFSILSQLFLIWGCKRGPSCQPVLNANIFWTISVTVVVKSEGLLSLRIYINTPPAYSVKSKHNPQLRNCLPFRFITIQEVELLI